MKFSLSLSIVLFILAGCISIKAPDNLVSDTVDLSKNIYKSVKDTVSDDENIDEESAFSFSYDIPDNEAVSISNGKCIAAAVEQAKQALNKYRLNIQKTHASISIVNEKSVMKCSVSL